MNNNEKIHKIKFIPGPLNLKKITLKNLEKALLDRRGPMAEVLLMPLFTPISPVFVYIFIPSILNVFLTVIAIVYTLFSLRLLVAHSNNVWPFPLFACPLYLFGGTMAAFLFVFLFDLSLFTVAMAIFNAVGIIVALNTMNYLQCSLGKFIRIPAFVLVLIALSSYCFVCLNLLHIITLPPGFLYTLISLPAPCVFIMLVMIVFLQMIYGQVFKDVDAYNLCYVKRINQDTSVSTENIEKMQTRISRLKIYQLFLDNDNKRSIELVNKIVNEYKPLPTDEMNNNTIGDTLTACSTKTQEEEEQKKESCCLHLKAK